MPSYSAGDRVRVGTDVQSVDEVSYAMSRFGDNYTTRVYTPHEITSCTGTQPVAAARLAARFAAKEAALKVLRIEGPTPDLRSIEVVRHENGTCELKLTGAAAQLAAEAGLTDWDLSLSHSGAVATATVIAVRNDGSPARRSATSTQVGRK